MHSVLASDGHSRPVYGAAPAQCISYTKSASSGGDHELRLASSGQKAAAMIVTTSNSWQQVQATRVFEHRGFEADTAEMEEMKPGEEKRVPRELTPRIRVRVSKPNTTTKLRHKSQPSQKHPALATCRRGKSVAD